MGCADAAPIYTVLRVVAIFVAGALPDSTVGMTSELRQRLGDRWGDTYVIED